MVDPSKEVTSNGARFGAIQHWRDGITTRGVLLDVPKHRGLPCVTIETPVHGQELEDIAERNRFLETFVVESWLEHLRQHERVTAGDRVMLEAAFRFHRGDDGPHDPHERRQHIPDQHDRTPRRLARSAAVKPGSCIETGAASGRRLRFDLAGVAHARCITALANASWRARTASADRDIPIQQHGFVR